MTTHPQFESLSDNQTAKTARYLRNLYVARAGFSIIWVILISVFAAKNSLIATVLLIIYPAWDAVATLFDVRSNIQNASSKRPQYINVAISSITSIAAAIALQKGVPQAIIVFGAWAIISGCIQLILGLRRRKLLNGQWPMIFSGGQSVLAGIAFIILAHDPSKGIASLGGYAAFGAFYYLLAVLRLSRPKAN